jgi:4,5:9,10-diseco-3-hydroxy-5,9,17-trioxoandrosta-1(10),2-diene-4-oate hydrolase
MDYPPPDRYVQVGDIKTRYWAVGESGSALILIHGILRFAEDWTHNLEALAQTHRVYAIDLIGYGCTDKPDIEYRLDDFVAFVRGFMDAVGIERATLIGHSLGGGVAINVAHRYPERVERLVLVAGAGFGQKVHLFFRLASLPVLPRLWAHPTRLIMRQAFRQVVYDGDLITDDMVDLAYERFYLPGARAALLKTIRNGVTLPGIRREILTLVQEALPSITMPTLIIWGRQDPVLPVAHADIAIERLPNARLHLLDECGHFPMFEHPHIFNALVNEFLVESGTIAPPSFLLAQVAD